MMTATMSRTTDEILRDAAADQAAAELEKVRVAITGRLAELEKARQKEVPPAEKRLAAAEKALAKVLPTYLSAKEEAEAARGEVRRIQSQSHDQAERLRAQLRVRLPFPEVEDARRRLAELVEETRAMRQSVEYGSPKNHPISGMQYHPTTHSTGPAILRRLDFLTMALRSDSGALAQAAELPTRAETLEAIAAIFAGIPEVGDPEPI